MSDSNTPVVYVPDNSNYKPPNRALYLTVALIVLFITTIASISFVSYRAPNNQEVIIGGVLAFAGTAITSILSMLVALNVGDGVKQVNSKVDGSLTALAKENINLTKTVVAAQQQTNIAQAATQKIQDLGS